MDRIIVSVLKLVINVSCILLIGLGKQQIPKTVRQRLVNPLKVELVSACGLRATSLFETWLENSAGLCLSIFRPRLL